MSQPGKLGRLIWFRTSSRSLYVDMFYRLYPSRVRAGIWTNCQYRILRAVGK